MFGPIRYIPVRKIFSNCWRFIVYSLLILSVFYLIDVYVFRNVPVKSSSLLKVKPTQTLISSLNDNASLEVKASRLARPPNPNQKAPASGKLLPPYNVAAPGHGGPKDAIPALTILKNKGTTTPKEVLLKDNLKFVTDGICPDLKCTGDENSVFIQSGYTMRYCPVVCLNGENLFKHMYNASICPTKFRGLSLFVIDQVNLSLKSNKSFDTYIKDEEIRNFLIDSIGNGNIVLAVSFDDAATALRDVTRSLFRYYGAQYAADIKFRSSYVLLGQRGLDEGYAYESLVHKRGDEKFASPSHLSVCAKFPLGKITNLPPPSELRQSENNVAIGTMAQCNLGSSCPSPTTIPVYISTGNSNKGDLVMCINSRLVFHPIMKNGAKGFNLAEYDPVRQVVISSNNFDPAKEEPTRLFMFLNQIAHGNLLFGVVHEDASARPVHFYFEMFGITVTKSLARRSVLWFVGQRGAPDALQAIIKAEKDGYSKMLTYRGCVPTQISGLRFTGHSVVTFNKSSSITFQKEHIETIEPRRTKFCQKNPGYNDFCFSSDQTFRQSITDISSELVQRHWLNIVESGIQQIPIIVVAGLDFDLLRLTLETLNNQPALDHDRVRVVAPDWMSDSELSGLVKDVFGFSLQKISVTGYNDLIFNALGEGAEFSIEFHAQSFIFIEPDVSLSPDFFVYMANTYRIYKEDPTSYGGISAWNPNGFEQFSNNENATYLSQSVLPSPCFLMRTKFFIDVVRQSFDKCCSRNDTRLLPWKFESNDLVPFIVPELSRCFKTPPSLAVAKGFEQEAKAIQRVYHRPRKTQMRLPDVFTEDNHKVLFNHLSLQSYDNWLADFVSKSQMIEMDFESCSKWSKKNDRTGFSRLQSELDKFIVVFKQNGENDWNELKKIAECFQLHAVAVTSTPYAIQLGVMPVGLYKKTYRFSTPTAEFILVSKASPFYTYKLANRLPNRRR